MESVEDARAEKCPIFFRDENEKKLGEERWVDGGLDRQ